MKALIFHSEEDARLVASQLYGCQVEGKFITFTHADSAAIRLAIALADVDIPLLEGARCLLPFPRHERECRDDKTPKVYISCLSSYNAGFLHGLYIDATQEPEDIQDDIDWMLSWSPVVEEEVCEEYAIHDVENFYGISISELESLETVSALAQQIAEHGAAMAAFLDWKRDHYLTPDIAEIASHFDEYFCGHWDSEVDFVERSDEIEEMLNWSTFQKQHPFLSFHIDWEGVARDLFIDSYHSVSVRSYLHDSWGVYVFRDF